MATVKNICGLSDGNQILGSFPNLKKAEINFRGRNNILYCEPGVILNDSILNFNGDNSLIYLGTNGSEYKLSVSIYNDSVFHMGVHNYINQKVTVFLSEQRHCFIGDYGIFSWGICIRNSDPHLIYDCDTRTRINQTRSVYIGDHVWIGQDSLILKGTKIDSGSIIGGMSVVSGKSIMHNTAWGGNPARQIKKNIFWDSDCVHAWKSEMTEMSNYYDKYIDNYHKGNSSKRWIYQFSEAEEINYDEIELNLNELKDSICKCDYLIQLNSVKKKNRFVHRH